MTSASHRGSGHGSHGTCRVIGASVVGSRVAHPLAPYRVSCRSPRASPGQYEPSPRPTGLEALVCLGRARRRQYLGHPRRDRAALDRVPQPLELVERPVLPEHHHLLEPDALGAVALPAPHVDERTTVTHGGHDDVALDGSVGECVDALGHDRHGRRPRTRPHAARCGPAPASAPAPRPWVRRRR